MTLSTLNPADAAAAARTKINAAFAAIDSNAAAIPALQSTLEAELAVEQQARSAAIAVEQQARVTADGVEQQSRQLGDGLLQQAIDAESVLRQQQVASLLATTLKPLLDHANKPGAVPFLFTSSLPGLPGVVAPLPGLGAIMTTLGLAYRVTGSATVATRRTVWLEAGRVTAVRWNWLRFSAPSDPSNDAVTVGIAWLDQNGALLSTTSVRTTTQPAPAAGMQVISARVPSQAGDAVAIVPPAGAVEWRAYVQSFGLDAVTDFLAITTTDVTDAGSYSPDLTSTNNRVSTLETEVAALNPLAAGVINGLATVDSSGVVVQLPMLKSAFVSAAAQLVADAGSLIANAIASLPATAANLALQAEDRYGPFVRVGDAWSIVAQTALGLTAAQLTAIYATIGSPAQSAGAVPPIVLYDLSTTTANVLRAARTLFAGSTVAGASMKQFYASQIGDQDSDSYFLAFVEPHAPWNGGLYQLLNHYLSAPKTDAAPGLALSSSVALAAMQTIWTNAPTYKP